MEEDYYILQSGTLTRCENTVYFENESTKRDIPINKIRAIYAMGPLSLSSGVIHLFAKEKVLIHFFDYYGHYDGSFVPKESMPAGQVKIEQVKVYLDREQRLSLALEFVRGGAKNILKNLVYYNNEGYEAIKNVILFIEKMVELLDNTEFSDTTEIMNIEGRIRETYYNALDAILPEEFRIGKRERQPPGNRGNALISFGNSLLYSTILSEIYHTHLDPTISYLHAPGERRFSLCLDVSEIFKPIIVDRVILKVVNKNMITDRDFVEEMGGLLLNEKGKRTFIKEWDEKLATTIYHRNLDRRVSFRQLIRLELYKLEKHFVEGELYKPLIMWW